MTEYIFIFLHETGSNINNDNNNRKLNYKHLFKYYNCRIGKKPFTVKTHRNINLSCLLLRTQLGRSIAKQL